MVYNVYKEEEEGKEDTLFKEEVTLGQAVSSVDNWFLDNYKKNVSLSDVETSDETMYIFLDGKLTFMIVPKGVNYE